MSGITTIIEIQIFTFKKILASQIHASWHNVEKTKWADMVQNGAVKNPEKSTPMNGHDRDVTETAENDDLSSTFLITKAGQLTMY